jgi:predicted RNA-binding protein with PUA-like domain
MAYWLLKTEPTVYSYADLESDKKTTWDGVTNPLALKHIRQVQKRDLALIYHTGEEKAAVGIAEIVSNAYPDPKKGDAKLAVFDLQAKQKLTRPVTLAQIKADPRFKNFELVRMARLSVMPVSESIWEAIMKMAAER